MFSASAEDMFNELDLPNLANGHHLFDCSDDMQRYMDAIESDERARLTESAADINNLFNRNDIFQYQNDSFDSNHNIYGSRRQEHSKYGLSTPIQDTIDMFSLPLSTPNSYINRSLPTSYPFPPTPNMSANSQKSIFDSPLSQVLTDSQCIKMELEQEEDDEVRICRKARKSSRSKISPRRKNNKDMELADTFNIPATPCQLAEFTYEELKTFITRNEFTDYQIQLIKAMRRRGRNKKSVALYRLKKLRTDKY
uniref:BZIP_Maf domain-containing protein n=1 Tax=Rhabditophanes sp. KR3021 TaxID=114890 RepID=A0AC35TR03_9BILA